MASHLKRSQVQFIYVFSTVYSWLFSSSPLPRKKQVFKDSLNIRRLGISNPTTEIMARLKKICHVMTWDPHSGSKLFPRHVAGSRSLVKTAVRELRDCKKRVDASLASLAFEKKLYSFHSHARMSIKAIRIHGVPFSILHVLPHVTPYKKFSREERVNKFVCKRREAAT